MYEEKKKKKEEDDIWWECLHSYRHPLASQDDLTIDFIITPRAHVLVLSQTRLKTEPRIALCLVQFIQSSNHTPPLAYNSANRRVSGITTMEHHRIFPFIRPHWDFKA
jgi:hypothetical protein